MPNAAKAWAKQSRGAKGGSILGALGILPFGTYVAIGMADTSGRSISATAGSFTGFLAGVLASLAVFAAVLFVAAGFGGMVGDFIGRLVAPPSGQNQSSACPVAGRAIPMSGQIGLFARCKTCLRVRR